MLSSSLQVDLPRLCTCDCVCVYACVSVCLPVYLFVYLRVSSICNASSTCVLLSRYLYRCVYSIVITGNDDTNSRLLFIHSASASNAFCQERFRVFAVYLLTIILIRNCFHMLHECASLAESDPSQVNSPLNQLLCRDLEQVLHSHNC